MLYVDDDAWISSPRMLQFMVIGLKDPVRCWWKAAVTLHCLPTTSSRAKKEGVTRHWHLAAAASSQDRAGRMVGVHLWMNRCIFCCIWMLSWSKFHFDNRIGWDPGLAVRPCNHAILNLELSIVIWKWKSAQKWGIESHIAQTAN